ncbi:WavE lipopolysaccharide synthesis family protein [Leminorella grimontii]|uniref:WavE lipopolysaccharide synthesis family protein n=1 Tax=Leminorella grimontii TaxID=82981 RepID=UPI002083182F|nr:WavE lipopolysaccharide synthesis family protein [Leminorella grimontii]GKX58422.1 hypothetical protein SOASR031_07370 [Leminorella grimontii]
MKSISVIFSGVGYKEFDIYYSVQLVRQLFPGSEIILSSNDRTLISHASELAIFDKIVVCNDYGELPSLKFSKKATNDIINNNIKKQIDASYMGISEASNELVLKVRTDQVLLNNKILDLWESINKIPLMNNSHRGRIITSSIFSINPRYSERMPYHLSDMFQFGYKEDLLDYYSVPEYPFEYAIWYETHPYAKHSNRSELLFRSKYAVEQWLLMHYIFRSEDKFPIKYHNDFSEEIIKNFETIITDYFIIAHPDDIGLRASKFFSSISYVNNQCYSTYDSLKLLEINNSLDQKLSHRFAPRGINKTIFKYLWFALDFKIIQFFVKNMPNGFKVMIKKKIS